MATINLELTPHQVVVLQTALANFSPCPSMDSEQATRFLNTSNKILSNIAELKREQYEAKK